LQTALAQVKGCFMFNAVPIFGWLISLSLNISLAVPFWFLWTYCDLSSIYFSFLPVRYHDIPFWHCVGLFIIISILKAVFVPTLVSVNNSGKNE
jgi:hypothetical protein